MTLEEDCNKIIKLQNEYAEMQRDVFDKKMEMEQKYNQELNDLMAPLNEKKMEIDKAMTENFGVCEGQTVTVMGVIQLVVRIVKRLFKDGIFGAFKQ